MFIAAAVALVLQSSPGAVVWSEAPPSPQAAAEISPTPASVLPDWARGDPFAYERAQCSPLLRREPTNEACQARVRGELLAALGDDLPAALRPIASLEDCRQAQADGAFDLRCGAPQRRGAETPALTERVCETRPTANRGGGVSWSETCRPANAPVREGLTFKLFGRD